MDDDYIKRKSVYNVVNTWVEQTDSKIRAKLIHADIEAIPAADVRPVVHGKWERVPFSFTGSYRCSNCHMKTYYKFSNFCPECGADMWENPNAK